MADSQQLPRCLSNSVNVDGVDLFYREAGKPSDPTIVLLHGYPSSSHQFRHLMPILAKRFHVLAPDYPGFGFTVVPEARKYDYTFDHLAGTVSAWLAKLEVRRYALYIFDYGSPVGFRLALERPSAVTALITQNGNAYTAGLGPAFSTLSDYYNDPDDAKAEEAARDFNTAKGVKMQYFAGVSNPEKIELDAYALDGALLSRPGNMEIQLGLFRNYKTNVESYPKWHSYLKQHQPPVLAIWGKDDPIFCPPGAHAFKQDVPNAEIVLLPGGHFLLETNVEVVGERILEFLGKVNTT